MTRVLRALFAYIRTTGRLIGLIGEHYLRQAKAIEALDRKNRGLASEIEVLRAELQRFAAESVDLRIAVDGVRCTFEETNYLINRAMQKSDAALSVGAALGVHPHEKEQC